MPAVSKNQRIAMAIAEHNPQELYARNAGLKKMSKSQLHDFASTKEKGLPTRKGKRQGPKRLPRPGPSAPKRLLKSFKPGKTKF